MRESFQYVPVRDFAIDTYAVLAQRWGFGHRLKSQGKPHFEEFLRKVKNGEQSDPASNMRILDGFGYNVEGADILENQKGVLLLSNHSVEGPLRGYGNTFLIDYIFNQVTEGKIRWAQGNGKFVAELVHNVLGRTMNTITVGAGTGITGVKELLRAWDRGENVGLYPEGKQRKKLKKADPRAGKVILLAAQKGIPIIYASSYFENNNFNLKIGQVPQISLDSTPQQALDHAMNTIARGLPEKLRGYYRQSSHLISSSEK